MTSNEIALLIGLGLRNSYQPQEYVSLQKLDHYQGQSRWVRVKKGQIAILV